MNRQMLREMRSLANATGRVVIADLVDRMAEWDYTVEETHRDLLALTEAEMVVVYPCQVRSELDARTEALALSAGCTTHHFCAIRNPIQ